MPVSFIIFVGLATVSVLVFYAIRRLWPHLSVSLPKSLPAAENFRPLFAPSENEIREDARNAADRIEAAGFEQGGRKKKETLAAIEEFRHVWRNNPDRTNTIELLYKASKSENGSIYLEVSEEIVHSWHARTLPELSGHDLAEVLEGQFWLVPAGERTPGVSFRLRKEIEGLRRGPR